MAERITQAEFARRKGVTRQTISEAAKRGAVEIDKNGRIDWETQSKIWDDARDVTKPASKADLEKLKEYQEQAGGMLSAELQMGLDNGDLTLAQANQVRGILAARKEEIELKKLKGSLIDIEVMQSDLVGILSIIRSKFMALPTKLAISLENKERSQIEKILKKAIWESLEELANKAEAKRV